MGGASSSPESPDISGPTVQAVSAAAITANAAATADTAPTAPTVVDVSSSVTDTVSIVVGADAAEVADVAHPVQNNVSIAVGADAANVADVAHPAQNKVRKRAPPSGRNLTPDMVCPLPCSDPKELPTGASLGLCGPSELRGMLRTRAEVTTTCGFELPHTPESLTTLELLRSKLQYVTKAVGITLLKPKAGRSDVAEHIFSFLEEGRPLVNTETGGLMYCDSGSANVDMFFQSIPQREPVDNFALRELVSNAWHESPEMCLRQIFHLGANKKGKQDRYSFYDAMLWVWQTQPATLIANLHLVAEANYWKGSLELLARICEGPQRSLERDKALHDAFKEHRPRLLMKDAIDNIPSGKFQVGWKPGSRLELAREALKRYDEDPVYRVLFERTGQLFAQQLRVDLAAKRAGRRIGLCAKWCPLLYHSFDRRTLICESIARWLFPATLPEFQGITERQYAYRARDKLRKVLSELKEYDKSIERLMCHQRWAEIKYNRVPATAMKIHTPIFEKHDPERFNGYLEDLASGKAKAKTGALQPYELLKGVEQGTKAERQVAQAQWEALVQKVKADGKNSECIAVCDVSGSMGTPATANANCMDVAISLSLLLAEVATGPYARKLITFHEDPTIVTLPQTKELLSLAQFARTMPWGGSTNFHKVFKLLLPMMPKPKRVIVFSDMQFSCATNADTNGTNLQMANKSGIGLV